MVVDGARFQNRISYFILLSFKKYASIVIMEKEEAAYHLNVWCRLEDGSWLSLRLL